MEKRTRERLLDAGIHVLGTRGARYATARAAEEEAGLPHGTMRHHFRNQDGYLKALAWRLLELDTPRAGESTRDAVQRWLTVDRTTTRARYELMLIGLRAPAVRDAVVAARERYVDALVDRGAAPQQARLLVASLDGVVLDGLVRGDEGPDPSQLLDLLPVPR